MEPDTDRHSSTGFGLDLLFCFGSNAGMPPNNNSHGASTYITAVRHLSQLISPSGCQTLKFAKLVRPLLVLHLTACTNHGVNNKRASQRPETCHCPRKAQPAPNQQPKSRHVVWGEMLSDPQRLVAASMTYEGRWTLGRYSPVLTYKNMGQHDLHSTSAVSGRHDLQQQVPRVRCREHNISRGDLQRVSLWPDLPGCCME